jgi:cell division protein FtsI/penicillin-binding protein 2
VTLKYFGPASLVVFLICGSAATIGAEASLDPKARTCLAAELAKLPIDEIPMAKGDAFALMDPHSGRVLWFRNRRVLARGSYQPGSIFKIITAYVAFSDRKLDPEEAYHCLGIKKTVGPEHSRVKCWLHSGHGPVNLSKALALSCNLYFANAGLQVGAAAILKASRQFGLGRSTGSDLGGEISGWLPSVATVDEAARLGTGQGKEVLVTPLQMLSLVAAVANDGILYSPKIEDPGGPPTKIRGELTDSAALRYIRDAMEEASTFGTGYAQRLKKLHLAGKTGTSAWLKKEWKTHAWYIGFAPHRTPLVALVVFIYDGQGSKEAAAVARKVMEATYQAMTTCKVLKK